MKIRKIIALLLLPMVCLLNVPLVAFAAEGSVDTKIVHKPAKAFVSGQRIALEAEVKDPTGADVVRVYFKSVQATDYHFVAMANVGGNDYAGTLPAPAKGAGSIDYLILVKNGANQVVKSQTFRVDVKDSEGEAVVADDKVQVYTELAEAPQEIVGFSDNIVVDVVESAVKFGYVAGLYQGMEVSSAVGAGAGATNAGTVAASTFAISTATMIGAGLVAAGVGVAAAGGGGGGGSSSSSSTTTSNPTTSVTTVDIVGAWNYSVTSPSCPGFQENGVATWTYSTGGYGLSYTTANSFDAVACRYLGPVTCNDPGPYPAPRPINEADFTAGLNNWSCAGITSGFVYSGANFISSNSIRIDILESGAYLYNASFTR